MTPLVRLARLTRLHPAWIVAAVTFLALVASAAFRSSTGVLMAPVEDEFGWSREWTSSAISLNLLLFGLTAPFAAALMDRFGIRRVAAIALALVATGSGLTVWMTHVWQLVALWGLIVGLGTGSIALVFGAIVANRWFEDRRGLVIGVFSAGNATGQLVFLPLIAYLAEHAGWRAASLVTAALALLIVPLILLLMPDRPAAAGLSPYGGAEPAVGAPADVPDPTPMAAGATSRPSAFRTAMSGLTGSARSVPFWILFATFFICGWSTNGLIQTHFVNAAHDHGMPPTTAASLLALIGIFDIVGTIGSGWLSDRIDPRLLLFAYYGLRGMSLLAAPGLLSDHVDAPLMLFVVFYGLDWVATVPPTVALCRERFGLERSGIVFGWVYAGHMIGAGVAATVAGTIRETTGSYSDAWWLAGVLCLLAAAMIFGIRRDRAPIRTPEEPPRRPAPTSPAGRA